MDAERMSAPAKYTLKARFQRMAAAVLCAAAAGSAVSSSPVQAETKSGIGDQQMVAHPAWKIGLIDAMPAACGDPGYKAPDSKQLNSMRCLINHARITQLGEAADLDETAQLKTDDQINCVDDELEIISHTACEEQPFAHFPPEYQWCGEILAWGRGRMGSSRSIFNAWMHSPTHRAVIENERFDSLGLALEHANGLTYWTGEFGDS